MRVKLLKKIRSEGRNEINIHSITKQDGCIVGMSYGYNEDCYSGLFDSGNTEEEVKEKAAKIYIGRTINYYRKKYRKYSVKYKKSANK